MKRKRFIASGFWFIAVLSLIFAFICFGLDMGDTNGSAVDKEYYGGDAYTGMQQASAQAANNAYFATLNLYCLGKGVAKISGMAFIIVSLVFGTLGLAEYIDWDDEKAKSYKKEQTQKEQSQKEHLPMAYYINTAIDTAGYVDYSCPECHEIVSLKKGDKFAKCPYCDCEMELK